MCQSYLRQWCVSKFNFQILPQTPTKITQLTYRDKKSFGLDCIEPDSLSLQAAHLPVITPLSLNTIFIFEQQWRGNQTTSTILSRISYFYSTSSQHHFVWFKLHSSMSPPELQPNQIPQFGHLWLWIDINQLSTHTSLSVDVDTKRSRKATRMPLLERAHTVSAASWRTRPTIKAHRTSSVLPTLV